MASDWIRVEDKEPDREEPIIYAKPKGDGRWSIGIAYWSVSQKWHPEMHCERALTGFTHYKLLGGLPNGDN